MGDCACKLKSYSKAIDYYKKALEAAEFNGESEKELIPIYVSIYTTMNDNKQHKEALEYLWKEHEIIKDEPREAHQVLSDIADTMKQAGNSFWDIENLYQKALTEAQKLEDVTAEKKVLQNLLKLCRDNNMESLIDIMEKNARDRGINLEEITVDSENLEIEGSEDPFLESPDFLEMIDLKNLSSDADSSDEDVADRPNVARRSKKRSMITKNEKGETKLHRACIEGNVQLVKMLLDQGHPVNVKDNAGWNPLHEACIDGHLGVVELLLNNGGNTIINDKGCDGITPLFDACCNGHIDVINLLLDRGAKVSIANDHGETALNSLDYWFETSGSDASESAYKDTRQRLVDQLEKMGLDTRSTGSSSNRSSGSSFKSKSSAKSSGHLIEDLTTQRSQRARSNRVPLNRSADSNVDFDAKKAKLEYKNVMDRLKNRNNAESRVVEVEAKRKKAYLESQDVDFDAWLEDDLGPSKKKQKFFNERILDRPRDDGSENDDERVSHKENSLSNSYPKRRSNPLELCSDSDEEENMTENTVINLNDLENDSDNSNSRDAFDFMMNNENARKKTNKTKSKSNQLSLNRNFSKRTSQSSLLEVGFSKFMDYDDMDYSSPPVTIQSNYNDHSFTNLNESNTQRNTSAGSEKQVIIKVQVDNEKIIVPVKQDSINDLKISWLVEETARRYYW